MDPQQHFLESKVVILFQRLMELLCPMHKRFFMFYEVYFQRILVFSWVSCKIEHSKSRSGTQVLFMTRASKDEN